MILLKEDTGAPDAALWKWLSEMIAKLGKDGMSSEESDDETNDGINPVLRPRILPWRRDIEGELRILDDQRHLDEDIFAPQGAKPVRRIRSPRNPPSNRKLVIGLPRAFYNHTWLTGQTDHYREKTLEVSKEVFQWMQIKATQRW
jgi:hypothetical protein